MVRVNTLTIDPPLCNSSCPWASSKQQLVDLYECPKTGAVTTRTATYDGFKEDKTHTVVFASSGVTSLNSYGYSPEPLSAYLRYIKEILLPPSASPTKPFIISITSSSPDELLEMVQSIQSLRRRFNDASAEHSRIGIELNTSCPNITDKPPPSYNFSSLLPLLMVLADAHKKDRSLTIGLKLPPYVYKTQFTDVLDTIRKFSYCVGLDDEEEEWRNPFAFFTCTNTLGNSLLFGDQVAGKDEPGQFALPNATGLGGLAGESIHPLSLGSVQTFSSLIKTSPKDSGLGKIVLFGVGGVTSAQAVARMHAAGASIVECATLLGKESVKAFDILSG